MIGFMLTGFQYRAALAVAKITLKSLSYSVGLHASTLLRLKKTPNCEFLNCHNKNLHVIIKFFESKNIFFPDNNSIQLKINQNSKDITRFHFVVARIATGLNQNELSQMLRISSGTISLLEKLNNTDALKTRKLLNNDIISFFERLGVVFNTNYTVTLKKDPKQFIKKFNMLLDTKT
jgi:DNA-binding Xre family transcriptional regulator